MGRKVTKIIEVDGLVPSRAKLEEAAAILRDGGLVAFPTETVYGLGACGLNQEAVKGIFEAKGRPATNPLILHVSSVEEARSLSREWPVEAEALAQAFWPGPLTLVVPRIEAIPASVCAGLDTVALRMPAHPVARALIELVGSPLAAPSANRYTRVSPTTAKHVFDGLGGRIDMIVDGGPTTVGLESTIVSVVETPPRILRPGMVDEVELSRVMEVSSATGLIVDDEMPRQAPGLSRRHYSPDATVRLVDSDRFDRFLRKPGQAFIRIGMGQADERTIWLPDDPREYARGLYAALHSFDVDDVDEIIIERPPANGAWTAICDRLRRAATQGAV